MDAPVLSGWLLKKELTPVEHQDDEWKRCLVVLTESELSWQVEGAVSSKEHSGSLDAAYLQVNTVILPDTRFAFSVSGLLFCGKSLEDRNNWLKAITYVVKVNHAHTSFLPEDRRSKSSQGSYIEYISHNKLPKTAEPTLKNVIGLNVQGRSPTLEKSSPSPKAFRKATTIDVYIDKSQLPAPNLQESLSPRKGSRRVSKEKKSKKSRLSLYMRKSIRKHSRSSSLVPPAR